MLIVKKLVAPLLLAFCASAAVAADDADTQGSFHGDVSDGSELKNENAYLEMLKDHKNWLAFGIFREDSSVARFKAFSAASGIYTAMVKENGGADIPAYPTDTLNLGGLNGYRAFAQNAMLNPSFVASPETCGAAVTFVYPATIAVLLFGKRAAYASGEVTSRDQWSYLSAQYAAQLGKDFKSLSALCAGQDPRIATGFGALVTNLSSDVDRVLPDADAGYEASHPEQAVHAAPPAESFYSATLSCGMNGQNYNVLACFKDSELKITTDQGGKLYKIYNLQNAGIIDQAGLHIKLPQHFELLAQNSQKTLVLTLSIMDSTGKIVYSDQQGQYGTVHVSN